MLIANVGNMLVNSIGRTLETGVVPKQYIVLISTVRRQSEVGIQRCIDVGLIVNFYLVSGGSMFHPLSLINAKSLSDCDYNRPNFTTK